MKKTLFILAIIAFSIVISVNVDVDKGTAVAFDNQNDSYSLPIHPPVG